MSHIQHLARSAEAPCEPAVSLLHRHPACRAEEDRRKDGRMDGHPEQRSVVMLPPCQLMALPQGRGQALIFPAMGGGC